MKLLKKDQQKPYQNAKVYYNCKEKIKYKHAKDKLGIAVIIKGNIKVLHIAYVI